jgi:hypothetical protein
MGAKKKSEKPKKLKVSKESIRKGALDDRDADKVAGGNMSYNAPCSLNK